jgi:hypothetical protein
MTNALTTEEKIQALDQTYVTIWANMQGFRKGSKKHRQLSAEFQKVSAELIKLKKLKASDFYLNVSTDELDLTKLLAQKITEIRKVGKQINKLPKTLADYGDKVHSLLVKYSTLHRESEDIEDSLGLKPSCYDIEGLLEWYQLNFG